MNWRPRSSTISGASRGASATETEYMELVDDAGSVIASFSQDTSGNVGLEVDSSPLMRMTTTRVATNVGTKQALLPAVPTGKVRIVTLVVARNASESLGDYDGAVNFGFDASAIQWAAMSSGQLTYLQDSSIQTSIYPFDWSAPGPVGPKSGAAGEVFGCAFGDTSITATLDIDVHYYDVDA